MESRVYKVQDQWLEKHLPVLEKKWLNLYLIKVGDIPHPMENDHLIEKIEVVFDNWDIEVWNLKPWDSPEIQFESNKTIKEIRSFCNLHWRWKKEL